LNMSEKQFYIVCFDFLSERKKLLQAAENCEDAANKVHEYIKYFCNAEVKELSVAPMRNANNFSEKPVDMNESLECLFPSGEIYYATFRF
jgi:hypothetical protein